MSAVDRDTDNITRPPFRDDKRGPEKKCRIGVEGDQKKKHNRATHGPTPGWETPQMDARSMGSADFFLPNAQRRSTHRVCNRIGVICHPLRPPFAVDLNAAHLILFRAPLRPVTGRPFLKPDSFTTSTANRKETLESIFPTNSDVPTRSW